MSFLARSLGRSDPPAALLYAAAVAIARDPAWYIEGQVPDTVEGRFDMLAMVTALLLLRLEGEAGAREAGVRLTERFVDDMKGNLREIGIGDLVVGKHAGRMVSALGGRLAALRDAGGDEAGFIAAVRRNVFHEAPPDDSAPAFVATRLARWRDALATSAAADLAAGRLPSP